MALAAKAMLDHGTDAKLTAWLVLTGLFMTIPSLMLLPSDEHGKTMKHDGVKESKAPTEDTGITPAAQSNS